VTVASTSAAVRWRRAAIPTIANRGVDSSDLRAALGRRSSAIPGSDSRPTSAICRRSN